MHFIFNSPHSKSTCHNIYLLLATSFRVPPTLVFAVPLIIFFAPLQPAFFVPFLPLPFAFFAFLLRARGKMMIRIFFKSPSDLYCKSSILRMPSVQTVFKNIASKLTSFCCFKSCSFKSHVGVIH